MALAEVASRIVPHSIYMILVVKEKHMILCTSCLLNLEVQARKLYEIMNFC